MSRKGDKIANSYTVYQISEIIKDYPEEWRLMLSMAMLGNFSMKNICKHLKIPEMAIPEMVKLYKRARMKMWHFTHREESKKKYEQTKKKQSKRKI